MKESQEILDLEKALAALEESFRTLVDMEDPRSVLNAIANQVRQVAELEECSVILLDDEEHATVVASSERPDITDTSIKIANYPELRRVIDTKLPLLIDDVTASPLLDEVREVLNRKKILSMALLPISVGEQMLGVLFLRLSRLGDPMSGMPLSYFQATANAAALALRNIRLKKDVIIFEKQIGEAIQVAREEQKYRRRYEKLFHLATDGLIIIDRQGHVIDINRKFELLTGYSFDEAMKMSYLDLVLPADNPKAKDFFHEYRRNPTAQRKHLRIVAKSGEVKYVIVGVDLLSGEEGQAVISIQDITEEKRLQNQLQRTKEFFENLIRSSMDVIIAADIRGNVIIFNEGAERISGYKAEEVVGKMNIVDIYTPGAAKDVMRRLRSPEYGGVGKLEGTHYSLIGKNGENIPISVSAAIIYEEGKEIASVGIFQDLRPRIRIEQELRAAQEKLIEAEKQTALAALSGTTAHELNQPLTSILGYAELLQKRLSGQDNIISKAIDTIAREADRMSETIKKIARISQFRTRDYVGRTRILDLDSAAMPSSRYENLFLSMRDGLLEFRCDDRGMPIECVYANPSAVRILGRAGVSDILERSPAELFGAPEISERIMKVASEKKAATPIIVKAPRPDGSVVAIEILANFVETDETISAVELLCRDVTERTNAQEKLAEAEQRARTLLEMAGELGLGLMIMNLDGPDQGEITYANERFEKILGITAAEMRTFPLMNIILPSDRDKFTQLYENAKQGKKEIQNLQAEVVRRDGSIVPIELHTIITQYLGRKALIGFLRDISDWVKTREELRRLKDLNENVINNAPIGIITLDADGTVLSINDYNQKIMGLPSKDVIAGVNLFTLSTIVGTEVEQFLREGMSGKRVSVSRLPYTSISGRPMILRVEGVPFADAAGKVLGGIVLLEDVTLEAELEESLRRERVYHESIIEQSPNPICGLALDLSIVLFNKAAEKMSGYSRDELLGKNALDLFLSDQITPNIIQSSLKKLENGETVSDILTRLRTKKGEMFEILWTMIPVKDEKGILSGGVGIGRNVTEERRLSIETARKRSVIEAMHHIVRVSIEGGGFKEICSALKKEIAKIMDHDALSITIANGDRANYMFLHNKVARTPSRGSFPLKDTFTEILIQSRKPRLVKNYEELGDLKLDDMRVAAAGVRSAMNVPIHYRDKVIGTMNVGSMKAEAYSDEYLGIFSQIADEFAIALENFQLMRQLRRSNDDLARKTRYLETLLQAGRTFRIDIHEREAVLRYVEGIEDLFPSPHLLVYLSGPQKEVLVPVYARQLPIEKAEQPLQIEKSIKKWLETPEDYVYHRDLKRVKGYEPFMPDARAALIVPLKVGDERLGLLVAESHHISPFRPDDLDLIVLMTRNMAASINNIRLFEQACFLERTQEDILENASALITAVNKDGILTIFNRAFEKFSGYTKAELIGRPLLDVFKRSKREDVALRIWNLLSTGKDMRNQVVPLQTREGKPIKAVFASTTVRDPRGEIAQYIFVGHDIADREVLERQLAQSAKLASLGQMAASVAHELNNPLTSISSYAQMLSRIFKMSGKREKEEQFVDKILSSTERIEQLIGKLMDYSRMDTEDKKPLEINEIIEDTLSFSEFDLTRGNVRIAKKLGANLPSIFGSDNQLQQVLINLLSNANYFLQKQGGGTITIRSYKERDKTVRIEVKDNGPGMSSEEAEHIFEPFFTTKPRGEGTGLGLNIVQNIINKHNGDIKVKTGLGKGTKFTIILPAYSKRAKSAKPKKRVKKK